MKKAELYIDGELVASYHITCTFGTTGCPTVILSGTQNNLTEAIATALLSAADAAEEQHE